MILYRVCLATFVCSLILIKSLWLYTLFNGSFSITCLPSQESTFIDDYCKKVVNRKSTLGVITVITIGLAATVLVQSQLSYGIINSLEFDRKAPIATSGDKNVYVAWWTNKTGNDEVMFKASSDGGKTFSDKMNLSNTAKSDSQDVQIAAEGNNVYVTWWERNQTSNEPVMRISNDNGKTFGQEIMLSSNTTSGAM